MNGTHSDPIASESAGPNEQAASRERVARSREALRALKPQELRALTLKAQGYSYAEIGEITGWTYTRARVATALAYVSFGFEAWRGAIVRLWLEPPAWAESRAQASAPCGGGRQAVGLAG